MPFCSNCGQRLTDNAKFCPNCGATVEKGREDVTPERKQVFEGEIRKCPNCGEALKAFEATCPVCGYELRGVKASDSIQEFYARLERASTDEQRAALIRSYPIPNSKEDIIEFIILASTNIDSAKESTFDAWATKFEQSYQKAKLAFPNGPDFSEIQKIYKKTNQKISKRKFAQNAKIVGTSISKSGTFLSKLFEFIFRNSGVVLGLISYLLAIRTYNTGGNGSGYELLGGILLIASAATLKNRKASYFEIAMGGASGGLSLFLARFLDNGSMLELCGGIVLIISVVSLFKKSGSIKDEKTDNDED